MIGFSNRWGLYEVTPKIPTAAQARIWPADFVARQLQPAVGDAHSSRLVRGAKSGPVPSAAIFLMTSLVKTKETEKAEYAKGE